MANPEFYRTAEQKRFLALALTTCRKNDSNMYLPQEDENQFDLPANVIPIGS